MGDLQGQVEDLRYFSGSALETAKRLQGIIKDLSLRLKYLKQQVIPDVEDVDNTDDDS